MYKTSNFYKNSTFFIGGALGCPDMLEYGTEPDLKRSTIVERWDFRRYQADNCYNYYILNHSLWPWYTLERPGKATDDPLTQTDPNQAILNNCQPLVNGYDALRLQFATEDAQGPDDFDLHHKPDERKAGYAPVWAYRGRPDMDEAEYLLSTYLQYTWNEDFVNGPNYTYKLKEQIPGTYPAIPLPCVRTPDGFNYGGSFPTNPNPHKPKKTSKVKCGNESGNGNTGSPTESPSPDQCAIPQFPLPQDLAYNPPSAIQPYYCPNVEKIVEPSHPFSPRHDIALLNDRDYSNMTSLKLPNPVPYKYCGSSEDTEWGYNIYNVPNAMTGQEKIMAPVVMCGIVPVDILNFRAAAFDTCIMQRINYNINQFLLLWATTEVYPGASVGLNNHMDGTGWNPPCKTRYWETDSSVECPVKMSIQQCCRIITKDVVPANFLKLRTCEGLRQSRIDNQSLQNYFHNEMEHFFPNPDSPVDHINDDTFGIFRTDNEGTSVPLYYESAQWKANDKLVNESACYNTEPYEYRFSSFFLPFFDAFNGRFVGYHMPYMRWWDTGVSAGNPRHGGSFVNTLGGFDVLIGVGREERSKQDGKDTKKLAMDEVGRSEADVSWLEAPRGSEMGRVGGWSELKAHEMWTIRRSNLFCVGRYEKLFKPGGQEALVLSKAGSGYTSVEGQQWPWSLGWRGYISDTSSNLPYGWGAVNNGSIGTGLDNALPGDIISYGINGMPQLAYVTDIGGYAVQGSDDPISGDIQAVFDKNIGKFRLGGPGGTILHPTRIYVVSWDQGKYPTSTGSTISWGMGPERTIYKKKVPTTYQQEICGFTLRLVTDSNPNETYCRLNITNDNELDPGQCMQHNCQPSCVDSDYSACVLPGSSYDWNNAGIWRPTWDVRQCPITPIPTNNNFNFDMDATYNWNDNLPLDPSVVYQSLSNAVYTNTWSWCVNAGYDPPAHWSKEYKGAQTGALTDTTLCGPTWNYRVPDDASDEEKAKALASGCSGAVLDPDAIKHFPDKQY